MKVFYNNLLKSVKNNSNRYILEKVGVNCINLNINVTQLFFLFNHCSNINVIWNILMFNIKLF